MNTPRKMITLKQILRFVPMGRSTLQRKEAAGEFPAGVMLSGNRKAWFEDEVLDWVETLPRTPVKPRKAS